MDGSTGVRIIELLFTADVMKYPGRIRHPMRYGCSVWGEDRTDELYYHCYYYTHSFKLLHASV